MKHIKNLGNLTVIVTVVISVFLLFYLPSHQDFLVTYTKEHPYTAPLIIILWRIIGIVIPPIPGGILSFALIPFLGWFWSYVYAVIGMMTGACIAFFIARKFREPLLSRFVSLKELHTWQDRLSNKTEFFTFLGIRLSTGSIMDFISYAAGLSKISFKRFFIITLISEIPYVVSFYLGEQAYKAFAEKSAFLGVAILLSLILSFYFLKDSTIFKKK